MERHPQWTQIINWTSDMAYKFGGTVYEKDSKTWDWGQALARGLYGRDWMRSERFQESNDTSPNEPYPHWEECKKLMDDFSNRNFPDWVDSSKFLLKD